MICRPRTHSDRDGVAADRKPQPLASGEFSTIRLRLLKVAVRIEETASRVRLAFAANCPDAGLFRDLMGALILASAIYSFRARLCDAVNEHR